MLSARAASSGGAGVVMNIWPEFVQVRARTSKPHRGAWTDNLGRVYAQFGPFCRSAGGVFPASLINRSFHIYPPTLTPSEDLEQDWQLRGTMSILPANSGLNSRFPRANAEQQSGNMWRPWTGSLTNTAAQTVSASCIDVFFCIYLIRSPLEVYDQPSLLLFAATSRFLTSTRKCPWLIRPKFPNSFTQ